MDQSLFTLVNSHLYSGSKCLFIQSIKSVSDRNLLLLLSDKPLEFISQCLRTKLKMQQNECEQKYYDFDHHVSSLLENKCKWPYFLFPLPSTRFHSITLLNIPFLTVGVDGYFDKAIEKGLINLKSVIKYSEVDSRFLYFWLACRLPHFSKLVREYEVRGILVKDLNLESKKTSWRGK